MENGQFIYKGFACDFHYFSRCFSIFLIAISWSLPGGMFSLLPINIPSTCQFLVGSIKFNPTKPDGTTWAGNHVHALRYLWNSTLGEQKALHRVRGPDANAVSGVMENVLRIHFKKPALFQGSPKKYLQLKSREITWIFRSWQEGVVRCWELSKGEPGKSLGP